MIDVKDLTRALQSLAGGRSGGVRAGQWATETDVPTTSTVYMHGPRGMFGVLGLEQDVISTRVVPRGLAGALPVQESNVLWPQFPYLMGFTAADEPDDAQGVCDDAPQAGPPTGCIQTAQFGRYTYETRPIDITHAGRQINRGEFMDLRLVNDPVGDPLLAPITPASADADPGAILNNEMLERMIEVGIAYQNKLVRQVYTGNPSNSNSGGGYREFPGLDILVSTGKVDAHTQTLCPNLDSLISDFLYAKVDTGTDIVTRFFDVYYHLKVRAMQQRLNPVRWAITMRMSLFNELSYIWPCAMAALRCSWTGVSAGVQEVISVDGQLQLQNEIRNGFFLPIHGDRVPVIIDDGIPEDDEDHGSVDADCFASDVYFIPLSYLGNRAATYWEMFNYREAVRLAQTANFGDTFWTDNGRFLWTKKVPKLWCIQLSSVIEPRIILRVPQLAAKIQNVQYCPFLHERSALPGDEGYNDTGISLRDAPDSLYNEWGTTE